MDEKTSTSKTLGNLHYLPLFANFLLTQKLEALIQRQLEIGLALKVPLLKYFMALPEEERIALSLKTVSEFLGYLIANKGAEQIHTSLQQWKANQLPVIDRNDIVAEDITLVNYMRKRAMLHFVTEYTKDPYEIIELTTEIDLFIMEAITAATNMYMGLYRQRLEENAYLVQKVAETVPGAIYVFDIEQYKSIYANNKLPEVIGYHQTDLNALGSDAIPNLIHPDDQKSLIEQLIAMRTSPANTPVTIKYRIRKKDGGYKWLANYESVFKRKEDGTVLQTIGITLDIDNEQNALEDLHKREQQLVAAQDIAQLGSFYWDFDGDKSTASPKTLALLEMDAYGYQNFLEKIHPGQQEKIKAALAEAKETGQFTCEYRIRTKAGMRSIWAKGVIDYQNGRATGMAGTIMDVTEHNHLLQKLAQSDSLHRQAEALSHIGAYAWNFVQDKIEWSEEMYRIYEAGKSATLNYSFILEAVHSDDVQVFDKAIKESIAGRQPYDFYYRIVTKTGREKILHSRGSIELDEYGQPEKIVGTSQDVTEKQSLILRLQKTEALYKQAEEIADMGNWNWDVGSNKLEWTDQLYRIYGLEPQSQTITIERFLSFVHPDDRQEVSRGVDRLATENSLDYTFRIITRDGTEKWLRSIAQVLRGPDGKPVKIVGTEQNVTERESLIHRLRESRTFIQKITDATPSIIASYNVTNGRYTFISEGLEKLLGYKTSEVAERGIAFFNDIVHPDDAAGLFDKNAKAMAEANGPNGNKDLVMEFTYRMKHLNGNYRWFHTYGTAFDFTADEQVEHVLNITLDVTEQQQAVETIREQEYFIQQLADASPTILYLFDVPTQSMAYINREAFFVLGYLPDEIIDGGNGITDLLYHPDDLALLPGRRQSIKNFQQVDSMIQYECRMKHKDGDYRWLLVREIVFKTAGDGAVTQITGAALDITRRKEMERTILQNTHQLEQSNASLEEFAYVASHDLKEPLRKISTFGDRLVASHSEKLNEEGKVYLKKIIDASQRMQNMISDLLSISMISGNRQFEKQNLQKILEETLQTLEFKIEQQSAIIRSNVLPDAQVIPSQFRQLFQNLLSNSLKFVRDGVQPVITVTCAVATEEETEAYQLRKSPAYLKLVFSDNGIGFESEYAQKIFAIFHRLHGRSEYEGSGIGLAICRKIVEHHGGVIYAESEPHSGATFTIIIPA